MGSNYKTKHCEMPFFHLVCGERSGDNEQSSAKYPKDGSEKQHAVKPVLESHFQNVVDSCFLL